MSTLTPPPDGLHLAYCTSSSLASSSSWLPSSSLAPPPPPHPPFALAHPHRFAFARQVSFHPVPVVWDKKNQNLLNRVLQSPVQSLWGIFWDKSRWSWDLSPWPRNKSRFTPLYCSYSRSLQKQGKQFSQNNTTEEEERRIRRRLRRRFRPPPPLPTARPRRTATRQQLSPPPAAAAACRPPAVRRHPPTFADVRRCRQNELPPPLPPPSATFIVAIARC